MKIVIIGDGKVGHKLTTQLSEENYDVVLIDQNEGKLKEAVKLLPCMVVGFLGGSALSRRMDSERLSRVIMAMLMLSGLALILQNI